MTAWRKWSTGAKSRLRPSARPASRAGIQSQSSDRVDPSLGTLRSAISMKALKRNPPTELGSPEGVAIDHLGRTVFWTDSVKDRIEVASLDGSQRRVIVNSDLVNPRAIITDPPGGCVLDNLRHLFFPRKRSASPDCLAAALCTGPTGTARPPRSRPPTWTDPTGGSWSKTT